MNCMEVGFDRFIKKKHIHSRPHLKLLFNLTPLYHIGEMFILLYVFNLS